MPISSDTLEKLYLDQKRSISEVAKILDVSVHSVMYWMQRYCIPRRQRSEANYLKHNPNGEPFNIKLELPLEEEKLKSLALGLYWGEGNKTSSHAVRVTNSDPGVIKVFLEFLLKVCRVDRSKIGYYLQTFKDNDIEVARIYWSKSLGIEPSQINTCEPVPSLGHGSYKKINRFGIMTIGFFNTHLKKWIMDELGELGSVG